MKRRTRSFVYKVLRSGKRLFADRHEEGAKRLRIISVAFDDREVNNIMVVDCGLEIDDAVQRKVSQLGEFKKLNVDVTNEGIELGESREMSLGDDGYDDDHGGGDSGSRIKRFGVVYTRKRKRSVATDSSLKLDGFGGNRGFRRVYEKRKKKKVRVSLESGFGGKYGSRKGPFVFAASCSYDSGDDSRNVCRFSCFVSSVLRYLRVTKRFSWRHFSSFLLLEPSSSIYSSTASQFLQDSTCTTSHGLFKHLTNKNATSHDFKLPSSAILERNLPLDKLVPTKKARSARKGTPRVSPSKNISQPNAWLHVESSVPVPGVREVTGHAEEDYAPFMLPESYISARGDELSRTLEKSYAVYDMDSDDEQWLKSCNHECLSEDAFEKIMYSFERGRYCSPRYYSKAASAVDQCLELASKEVLEDVYSYWMTKRKKKRSALVTVFKYYKQKRVKQRVTSAVSRKKRSVRRRKIQRVTKKQLDSKKAMLNDEKLLEESTKAHIKAQEAQEAAKRSEETSIVKRQQAQALMEAADLAVYRATMALRIAEARASGGSVDLITGAIFGSLAD